ncbi:Glycoside hydrolase, 38 vacuolar alpha mannosidase [Coemansia sp. RSA 1365]|nr:Glycoside hydrolase, 38 vacuolar alpha mannosidase [Coemansia sp. RSA 1365]
MQRHMSYLQKHPAITRTRVNNFVNDKGQWKDVNIQALLYDLRVSGEPHIKLEVWSAPGQERPSFKHAVNQEFRAAKVDEMFGPSWTTHWFRINVDIPKEFSGKAVQFLFDSNSEAMVWSAEGEPIMGLTGGNGGERHVDYLLTARASDNEPHRLFYVEVACNGLFGNGNYTERPQDRDIYYRLSSAELVAPNPSAWALFHDMEVIVEMAGRLPSESPRSWQALKAANDVVNAVERTELSTVDAARKISHAFLNVSSNPSSHQVYAIGNCHIDTAWLWPFAETRRKTARSWSTQLGLMDDYPDYRFAASQAQQFEWLQEDYPSLFKRIQQKAQDGQFIPIGGTWVEMDCNLPSGESLARQFLLGQRFFKKHFGKTCDVFWLPDTFGYSSQLPQIVRLSGAKYFFTQKLSWNNINTFPHTTFRWIGLDGSHILTHMAPSETYGAQCRPGELIDSLKKHKDIAYSNESLYLFGNGDGGGGPLRPMLERLSRMKNLDGIPRIKQSHPRQFYEHVEQNSHELVAWKGELYFELHRGTYTSQSNNKLWNRQSEFLLRDAELLSTVAAMGSCHDSAFEYPADELTRLWKLVCLNQFHDVIPGSAINMVYRDSREMYESIISSAKDIRKKATTSIFGSSFMCAAEQATGLAILNTSGWMRSDIVAVPEALYAQFIAAKSPMQIRTSDRAAFINVANVPGFGVQLIDTDVKTSTRAIEHPVRVLKDADSGYVMENRHVRVVINNIGHITSYYDKAERRELVPKGAAANVFELYDDVPGYWDAWDIEIYSLEKFKSLDASVVSIADQGPLVASLSVRVPISDGSVLTQTISLSEISPRLDFDCEIDWNENRKCLKVSFTWDIYSDMATYETQYGVVQRPTHRNTSWDMAKFEVCGHKFADISEFGYGVALLNDCKYGHATLENTMSLSLIRAPKSPDEHCDMGHHQFRYAIYPHSGTFSESNVVQEAYHFNLPLLQIPTSTGQNNTEVTLANSTLAPTPQKHHPFFSVSGARNVVLDTVKRAEDDSNSYIVRLYEAYGGHAHALITTRLPASKVVKVNILEEPLEDDTEGNHCGVRWLTHSTSLEVKFKPFEVVSLKFTK